MENNPILVGVLTVLITFALTVGWTAYVNENNDKIEFNTACRNLDMTKDQCIVMWYTRNTAH